MKQFGSKSILFRITLTGFIVLLLCTAASAPRNTQAASGSISGPGWIVVASQEKITIEGGVEIIADAIRMIDTATNTIYGPFMIDEFSRYDPEDDTIRLDNYVLDVIVTSDGQMALVSDYKLQLIHFVDIADPINPVYLSSVNLPIKPMDLVLTEDNHYAIVSDDGTKGSILSINLHTRTRAYELVLPTFDHTEIGEPIYGYANAVDVAPDGTIVMADVENGTIHSAILGKFGRLTYTGTQRYFLSYDGEVNFTKTDDNQAIAPVNIAIAPDGKTVLVSDKLNYVDTKLDQYANTFAVGVFQISTPGEIDFVEAITGLPRAMMAITFNESGDKAYMSGNDGHTYNASETPNDETLNDGLYVMDITGPGDVVFNNDQSADLQRYTKDLSLPESLYGVDGLAVYEGKAYITYPTLNIDEVLYPERFVSVVDLTSFELTQLDWGLAKEMIPIGLAVRHYIPEKVYLPLVLNR
ncbi:MAG: hypothetical protein CVU39_08895 [Chloroflexi bacterium HGW-Chloroflexi-10]|nr:MAG: hypothetical protein CVU39_08895 [Chloroflexi bacterium HGW-Chloroflexi-10]